MEGSQIQEGMEQVEKEGETELWQNKRNDKHLRTAVLARGIKGYHEAEVSFQSEGYDFEADLHRCLIDCDKNPGHDRFVPVTKFGLDHLPDNYKDQDIVDYIKCQADLTVRVTSKFTSQDRPAGYAFHDFKGSDILRVGTGFIQYVYLQANRSTDPCPCPECKRSGNPKKEWAKAKIRTATHVVFDKEEAKNTVVELFNDDSRNKGKVRYMYGDSVRFGAIQGDWCDMRCVTHDLELCEQLKDIWGRWRWLETKVNQKYPTNEDHRLAVVVSHPHGCNKQVSIGQWHEREVIDRAKNWENSVYTYDTATCPGSSGAPVWFLGRMRWGGFYGRHPHSGRPLKGFNVSGVGWDRSG